MSGKSVHFSPLAVAAVLTVVLLAFSWAFAAAQYAHAQQGWRARGVFEERGNPFNALDHQDGFQTEAIDAFFDFAGNALRQVPNAPAVLRFTWRKRLWLLGILVTLELGVVALALWMRSLERQWP